MIGSNKSMAEPKEELGVSKKSLDSLKQSYNGLLKTEQELEAYIDDLRIPVNEREKQVSKFKAILRWLNTLIVRIEEAGYAITSYEVCCGFQNNDFQLQKTRKWQ